MTIAVMARNPAMINPGERAKRLPEEESVGHKCEDPHGDHLANGDEKADKQCGELLLGIRWRIFLIGGNVGFTP